MHNKTGATFLVFFIQRQALPHQWGKLMGWEHKNGPVGTWQTTKRFSCGQTYDVPYLVYESCFLLRK